MVPTAITVRANDGLASERSPVNRRSRPHREPDPLALHVLSECDILRIVGVRRGRAVVVLAAAVLGVATVPRTVTGQASQLLGIQVGVIPKSPAQRVTVCVGKQQDIQLTVMRLVVAVYADAASPGGRRDVELAETHELQGVPLLVESRRPEIATVAPAKVNTGPGTALIKVKGVKRGTTTIRVSIPGSVTNFIPPMLRGNTTGKGELVLPVRVDECRYRISGHGSYEGSVIDAFMQLFPTYVNTMAGTTTTKSGRVFGAATWAGPCVSIIVGTYPDASVTAAVSSDGEKLTVTASFSPAFTSWPALTSRSVSRPGMGDSRNRDRSGAGFAGISDSR